MQVTMQSMAALTRDKFTAACTSHHSLYMHRKHKLHPCKVKSGTQTKIWSGNEAMHLGAGAHIAAGSLFAEWTWYDEKTGMNGLDELFEQILHSERNFKARINKLRECKPSFFCQNSKPTNSFYVMHNLQWAPGFNNARWNYSRWERGLMPFKGSWS